MMQLLQILLIANCLIAGQRVYGFRVRTTPSIDPVVCASYEHGTKIPNPLDCSSFYVCDRGIPEFVQCTGGLLFDVNLKVCNWPEHTTCVDGALTPHRNPETPNAEHVESSAEDKEIIDEVVAKTTTIAPTADPISLEETPKDISSGSNNEESIDTKPVGSSELVPETPNNEQEEINGSIGSEIPSEGAIENLPPKSEEIAVDTSLPSGKDDLVGSPVAPLSPQHSAEQETPKDDETDPSAQKGSAETPLITYPINDVDMVHSNLVQCTLDGVYYLPHPTKCDYYYICISKNLHENYCGANLYWDYLKQRCDTPATSICFSHVAGFTKPEDLRPVYPANQIEEVEPPKVKPEIVAPIVPEYIPTTRVPIVSEVYTMPEATKTTDVPPSTTSDVIILQAPSKPVASNQQVEIIEADLTASPPSPGPMDGYDPEHVRCIHEGVYFLPHPRDCEVYFICINHTMHVHRCGHNVNWDYIYNQCSAPEETRCYAQRKESETASQEVTDDGPANPMDGYDPEHVRCVHPGFYYLPHPTNCRVYFVCAHHTLNIYQCTIDTTWNYVDQYCSSANDKCYFDTQLALEQNQGTTPEQEHDLIQVLEGYDPDHVRCLHEGVYYLPHPTLCQMFFMCAHRTLTLHECSPGTLWNYAYERCDRPEDSKCFDSSYYRSTEASTTTLKTAPVVPSTTTERTTSTTTTTRPSTSTTTTSTTTPKPKTTLGVHMPMEIEQPDKVKDDGADLDVLPKCPRHQAFFPHSKDCRKYYICIGGVPILTKCPENLHWDVQQRMCGLPAHTKCAVGRKA